MNGVRDILNGAQWLNDLNVLNKLSLPDQRLVHELLDPLIIL